MNEHAFDCGNQQVEELAQHWQDYLTGTREATAQLFTPPQPDKPDVNLRALRANVILVEQLVAAQWIAILEAAEAGAGWDDIASATGSPRGAVWSQFCRQTDRLDPQTTEARRAAAIKDPLRSHPTRRT